MSADVFAPPPLGGNRRRNAGTTSSQPQPYNAPRHDTPLGAGVRTPIEPPLEPPLEPPPLRIKPPGTPRQSQAPNRFRSKNRQPQRRNDLAAPKRKAPPSESGSLWLSLLQAWRNLLTPGLCKTTDDEQYGPPAGYRWLRRWSPALAPAILGSLLLTVALLVVHHAAPHSSVARSGMLPLTPQVAHLFAIYGIGGAVLALALYAAPNVIYWLVALAAGVATLATALAAALAGPWAALIVAALALAVALLYTQAQLTLQPEGSVTITRLFDGSRRTLMAGYQTLLPGERPLVTFQTGEHVYTTPIQHVTLAQAGPGATPDGENWEARAAATVAYCVLPHEAYLLADAGTDWEQALHAAMVATLRNGLADWSAQAQATGGVIPEGALARRMLGEARNWARPLGIRIVWASVQNIAIGPPETQLQDSAASVTSPQDEPSGAAAHGTTYPTPLAPVSVPPSTPISTSFTKAATSAAPIRPSPTATTGAAHANNTTSGVLEPTRELDPAMAPSASLPLAPEATNQRQSGVSAPIQTRLPVQSRALPYAPGNVALSAPSDAMSYGSSDAAPPSADALTDLYDAVREQRIGDPTTIRAIGAGFAHLAEQQRHSGDQEADFDAEAAAQLLFAYAAQIEQSEQYAQSPS